MRVHWRIYDHLNAPHNVRVIISGISTRFKLVGETKKLCPDSYLNQGCVVQCCVECSAEFNMPVIILSLGDCN